MKSLFLPLMSLLLFTSANQLLAQDCKVLDPNLEGVYTGDCKNGKAAGLGKAVGKYTYEGEFKAGLPDGKGEMTDDQQRLLNIVTGRLKEILKKANVMVKAYFI